MNSQILLHLDRSSAHFLCLERDGQRVTVEEALKEGFVITANDAPAVLTLVSNFTKARDDA